MKRSSIFLLTALAFAPALHAQCDRWQQRIRCELDVDLDVYSHRFSGTERLTYSNNSPDTLAELYFHLYFNAFKPGSEMDIRSRTIADPDGRVLDRIARLTAQEQGDLRCSDALQDGRAVQLEHLGTVMRLRLARPVAPGRSTVITLAFNGQVPLQIRRSGRDNSEGIAYSMTQWYPKVAVYDQQGWHPDPYVGREFYGEWGDHELRITLDSAYTVAATGDLANAAEIGHGYAPRSRTQRRTDGRLTWHFRAPNVHDVAWAADRDYVHTTAQVPGGPLLHFFHKDQPELVAAWKELPGYMVRSFQYMAAHFGPYPYPHFSFAQGGDGGMEYPNLTLITGRRKLGSLVGTSVHESVHNWYYGMLGSDEASHPWMDEGFTEYASSEVMRHLFPGSQQGRVHADALEAYLQLAASDEHEPMSLHADHFRTNRGYSSTAYSKGEFFLDQLGAVIGDTVLHRGLLHYYQHCRFKHPDPVDVRRSMEKVSGLQLDWYFDEWINTTRTLDHAVGEVRETGDSLYITVLRTGEMLMPVDVLVTDGSGKEQLFHIPLSLMLGARREAIGPVATTALAPWTWTAPAYTFGIARPPGGPARVQVDPYERLAEADRTNDRLDWLPGTRSVVRP
jgi:hypothetical protein